jgi:hypothetical protein
MMPPELPAEDDQPEIKINLEGVDQVDWPVLWTAFVHPAAPSWEQLDPASRGAFKFNWYLQIMPGLHGLVTAVEAYDRRLKAQRN